MNQNIAADANLRELALTIARNEVGANLPLDQVLHSEAVTLAEYDTIAKNPQFQTYLRAIKAELEENGFSFAAKCRVLAEDLLTTTYHMAKDSDTPAAVRLRALENLVDWGDLKPKTAFAGAGGPGYSIVINLPGAANSTPTQIVLENDPQAPTGPTIELMSRTSTPSTPSPAPIIDNTNPMHALLTPVADDLQAYYDAEAEAQTQTQ